MTASREIALADLEARRRQVAALIDALQDQIDRWPSAAQQARLESMVQVLDAIDRRIAERKGSISD